MTTTVSGMPASRTSEYIQDALQYAVESRFEVPDKEEQEEEYEAEEDDDEEDVEAVVEEAEEEAKGEEVEEEELLDLTR